MTTSVINYGERTTVCVPHSTSYFQVEGSIVLDGMSADIRRYGWREPMESYFEPDVCYMDLGLARTGGATSMAGPGERYFSRPGGIVFLPAGRYFRTRCEPSEHRALCVAFDRSLLESILEDDLDYQEAVPHCLDVRDPAVERCLLRLLEEVREPGFGSELLVESVISTLVVEVYRHLLRRRASEAEMGGKLAGWRLKRLKERIEADLAKPLSISMLAADCGLSRRHLIRTFKNSEGVTLSDFIARARTDHAKQRLVQGELMMKEIAGECGFASAAAFSAAFRKATGKSPKQYREQAVRFAPRDRILA